MISVCEIFRSIQGETTASGFPSVFVRLTGCNLRCRYCDTRYAYDGGTPTRIDDIASKVREFPAPHHITLTGGEPLLQEETPRLVDTLLDIAPVRVETNGSIDIGRISDRAVRIVDVKGPSSGEAGSFLMDTINTLTERDEIKFVVSRDEDLTFAKDFITRHLSATRSVINISPVRGAITPARVASFILDEKLSVRLNLQLHTIVWPEGEPR
jgi:7-carboxy-7-deazaguanine synthase